MILRRADVTVAKGSRFKLTIGGTGSLHARLGSFTTGRADGGSGRGGLFPDDRGRFCGGHKEPSSGAGRWVLAPTKAVGLEHAVYSIAGSRQRMRVAAAGALQMGELSELCNIATQLPI
jgi:hypothetical protein